MQLTYSDVPHVIHVHSVFHTDLIRYKTLTMRYSKYSFVYATFVHMTYTHLDNLLTQLGQVFYLYVLKSLLESQQSHNFGLSGFFVHGFLHVDRFSSR